MSSRLTDSKKIKTVVHIRVVEYHYFIGFSSSVLLRVQGAGPVGVHAPPPGPLPGHPRGEGHQQRQGQEQTQ